jgi:hypothetical protein
MKVLHTILLLLLLFTSSYADEVSHRAAAEEFLTIMKTDQIMKPMFQGMEKMLVDMSKQMGIPEEESALFDRHMRRMIKMMEDEFGWDKMKDDFIKIHQETFTEDELKSFTSFYKTPAGQKYIEKTPLLMKKAMEREKKGTVLLNGFFRHKK